MLLSAWLTGFGWEALIPLVDHGRRTDLVIADDEGATIGFRESAEPCFPPQRLLSPAEIETIQSSTLGYVAPADCGHAVW